MIRRYTYNLCVSFFLQLLSLSWGWYFVHAYSCPLTISFPLLLYSFITLCWLHCIMIRCYTYSLCVTSFLQLLSLSWGCYFFHAYSCPHTIISPLLLYFFITLCWLHCIMIRHYTYNVCVSFFPQLLSLSWGCYFFHAYSCPLTISLPVLLYSFITQCWLHCIMIRSYTYSLCVSSFLQFLSLSWGCYFFACIFLSSHYQISTIFRAKVLLGYHIGLHESQTGF